MGFRYVNGTPVSCRLENTGDLPIGEWDEWYVFDTLPDVKIEEDFINNSLFTTTIDNEYSRAFWQQFWRQLEEVNPVRFLAQNGVFIFVSRDADDIKRLIHYFQNSPQNGTE